MPTIRSRRLRGEGSVYHGKDGRWSARFYLENGKRKTVYGKTRKETYEKLQNAVAQRKRVEFCLSVRHRGSHLGSEEVVL